MFDNRKTGPGPVVRCGGYLDDLTDFDEMNETYLAEFPIRCPRVGRAASSFAGSRRRLTARQYCPKSRPGGRQKDGRARR